MSLLVYPRLPLSASLTRVEEIRSTFNERGFDAVSAMSGVSHPRAAPVATGGHAATTDQISQMRNAVVASMSKWIDQQKVPSAQTSSFDLALGRSLHHNLQILPADAAHEATWSFLTLVVLPELAVLRFPDMHVKRMTGAQRNVLRRTWTRQEVLGDMLRTDGRSLGEDELVGLFERTALARNRDLVRRLALAVTNYDGPMARSEWARILYKQVTFYTGPLLVDSYSDDELDELIHEKCAPMQDDSVRAKMDFGWSRPDSNETADFASSEIQEPGTYYSAREDQEARLHRSIMERCRQTELEIGYGTEHLLNMVERKGAAATARQVVLDEQVSEDFLYLSERGRLDLTVEALVVDVRFADLFEIDLVKRAGHRLQAYAPK